MWNTTTLSQACSRLTATSLGNLSFFGGGLTTGNQPSNVVDIFNSTSQTWSTSTLSQARYQLAASTSIGEIVAFGGWDGLIYSVVDMLNVTSNTWFTVNLSHPRYLLASTSSTNNKILFGGGLRSTGLFFDIWFRFTLSFSITKFNVLAPKRQNSKFNNRFVSAVLLNQIFWFLYSFY
jgi:hypothetical protein